MATKNNSHSLFYDKRKFEYIAGVSLIAVREILPKDSQYALLSPIQFVMDREGDDIENQIRIELSKRIEAEQPAKA